MYVCKPPRTHTIGNMKTRGWLLSVFPKSSYNETVVTKNIIKTQAFLPRPHMQQPVLNLCLCHKKDMQITKSKTSWMKREMGNTHVFWWCLVFDLISHPPVWPRWANTQLSPKWMPETNRRLKLCPVNRSFMLVTDLLSKATSFLNAYWLIHRNTHLHHTLAFLSVQKSLPVWQHNLKAELEWATPANTYKKKRY